jgi:hypothetical protein
MHTRRSIWIAMSALLIVTVTTAGRVEAQEAESDSPFGIGFQSSWPSYGLSGLYDLNDRITIQGIVGALGTITSFGARGIYRFQNEDKYDLYGFGTAGLWSYDYVVDTENVLGFGGGAGVELDWRRILSPEDDSFPPLFSSIDIGFVLANFDHYDFSGVTIGGGLHYRF